MDLPGEKGSGSSDRSTGPNPESDLDQPRSCTYCQATKTPVWRAGPAGPKTLCNACGIRYRKKKAVAGLKEGGMMKNNTKKGVSLNLQRMKALIMKLKQGVLREEEEAAVLLMALSSGILCSAKS